MSKIVPLISSGTAGPLGILHLPRLWLKALLGATGQLADGYKDVGLGYDHMVLQALGIKPEDARAFIHEKKPTYQQFEEWVKKYPGVKLDNATIFKSNAAIAGYVHSDAARSEVLGCCGLPDDGSINPGAVALNDLDDWKAAHTSITGG